MISNNFHYDIKTKMFSLYEINQQFRKYERFKENVKNTTKDTQNSEMALRVSYCDLVSIMAILYHEPNRFLFQLFFFFLGN